MVQQKYHVPRLTPKHLDPKCLMFSMFTANDVRNLSVTKIRTPLSFNVLGHPLKGGLYDPVLGPLIESSDPCGTCGCNVFKCPGHFGHIELPMPVVNPLFHKELCMLMKLSCLNCFVLQIPPYIKLLLSANLRLLQKGYFSDLEGLQQEVMIVVSDSSNPYEVDIQAVQNVIENYSTNLFNRPSLNQSIVEYNDVQLNTKNINTQWHAYVESVLKQHTAPKVCVNCHNPIPKITTLKNKIMTTKVSDAPNEKTKSRGVIHKLETVLIMPDQSKEYLRNLWENEKEFLKVIVSCFALVDIEHPTDIFFLEVVPVLPPIVRPVNFVNGQMIEHPQTQVYKSIIQDCLVLRNIIQTIQDGDTEQLPEEGKLVFEQIKGNTPIEKLHNAWQSLQVNVDHIMDRDMNKTAESMNCQGLKQVIEKKEGVIRMHMMGKRVNFAARSVITPDPNLNIDEIGIPEAFALKLTYPTPVTPWNVVQLRQLVLNGPDVHPGAVMIEHEDGSIQRISTKDPVHREAIAKRLLTTSDKANKFFNGIKIVHRHLQTGDILLLNRQPTLHKPSIMAHKARILKGEKTLRLHYANCKAYNADFDGDEMNAHFPQNELARSEGYFIANVCNQYLVPKDGTPLSGLIQDHMVSGVRMTVRGAFFSREDYMQLVYAALSTMQDNIILLPPSILKPKPLWSGKQIISTVIINIIPLQRARINLTASAKINVREWQVEKPRRWKGGGTEFSDPKTMSEAEVIIRNGELLCGVLDKMHYGATPFGLVHCVFELYGATCTSQLLSAFGKLFQAGLQRNGFTLGIEDILLLRKADKKRREIISNCRKIGEDVHRSVLELPEDTPMDVVTSQMEESYWKNPKFRAQVDRKYKSALDVYTNDINKTCLPAGLLKKFPENNLQLMVQSGAKGSTVNTMQISCLLGQIELEGKRPPLMISGKSLPSFPAYDPSPRAGGFIDGRFMTGIKPQEFFFHCMAGREGLIDTAVKTSRSGYLQRCLIKHLEGLVVNYDSTVRDSDGSLIQIYYGEDGLDIPGSRFLKKEQLGFLVDNKNAIVDEGMLKHLKTDLESEQISKFAKRIKKWESKHGSALRKRRISPFTRFSMQDMNIKASKFKEIDENSGRSKASLSYMRKWLRDTEENKKWIYAECAKCPDPVMSRYRQDINFGVLSERLENLIDDYVTNKSTNPFIKKKDLKDLLSTKVMKTVCPPGEPVGLLAAQSIGEPCSQLTLNTFHFAGRGEMNVTLGIPRLREVLMMASKNIKTPSMEIPLRKDLDNVTKRSNKLRLKLAKCVLSDVLDNVTVNRKLEESPHRSLVYTMTVNFLPHKSYKGEFCVQPRDVLKKTEEIFFKELFREIKKVAKVTGALLHVEEEKKSLYEDDALLDQIEPGEAIESAPKPRANLGEMHESSDEEEAAEDADATVARSISRHKENQEYEDPEEEELEDVIDKDDDVAMENADQRSNANEERLDDEDDNVENRKTVKSVNETVNEQRKKNVTNLYVYALEYDYDEAKFTWCKLKFWLPLEMIKMDLPTIIRNVANRVVLWEVPCIKRAFTFQNKDGETILRTDGINIIEIFKYDRSLDLNRLYSNDIYAISQTYGIEAANRVIIKEVKDVFKMYGITVDSRHLSLIADYMTFDGRFQPLSRKGMEDSASPLQQMSFESSLNFLRNATLHGRRDNLVSPSSRLMLGQPCKSGTGACSLLVKIQKQPETTLSIGA
ncbi:DNA-directed RNA polymerase I subunit RPA1 [Ceratina calcarata]|uniref:DNA-directed RNA polymerase subunit n=1 Tax=Ceratina calcarata TaxID=156304 RepID=A0AAJ7IS78_9HYME|nr:DNA-directed RNA polymerase I subunit RPA1 [Ceratina calcarata]